VNCEPYEVANAGDLFRTTGSGVAETEGNDWKDCPEMKLEAGAAE